MVDFLKEGQGLLFMKVGVHAQEPLERIIERKQKEYENTGMIFWGYGGNTCHPVRHVQPFARELAGRGNDVVLVMEEINSHHFADPARAEEYSDDGLRWKPVPKDINVLGSRYALVLEQLQMEEFDIDLGALQVAVGPSRGLEAPGYLRGRVDKGCFEYHQIPSGEPRLKHIKLLAKLQAPFAVHVR